jgi:hypothetical protein
LKLIENRHVILRVATINISDFNEFEKIESYFYKLVKEEIVLEREIRDIILYLDGLLYKMVNNTNDNFAKKKILNIKRKIKRQKNIDVNELSTYILNQEIIDSIGKYCQLISKYKKVKEEKVNYLQIDDSEIQSLINIYLQNKNTLNKAISLSSLTFLTELDKNIKLSLKNILNKKRNDLTISLYKYLTRAAFKTSPFSFFCYQGIASFNETQLSLKKIFNTFDNADVLNVPSKSLIKDRSFKPKIYKVNRNIWISRDFIEVLKKENVNYRNLVMNNKSTLIKIDYDPLVEKFIVENNYRRFNIVELNNELKKIFTLNSEETKDYIDMMLKIGILEVEFYDDLESLNPPRLKLIKLDDNRKEHFNQLKNVGCKIPKIYEDVYFNKIINIDTFYPSANQIEDLNKLTLLFDDSIILTYKFIEFIGDTTTLNFLELLRLLNDFYEKVQQITNREINNILSLRSNLLTKIKDNIRQGKETLINTEDINDIYIKMNLFKNKPFSYTYFIQPISEHHFTLNKIFSGYGRMFSKFPDSDYKLNIIRGMHKKSLALLDDDLEYVDLYGIYGFNANVHTFVTENIIDIENIWNGNKLRDLSIQVNYETKELKFFLKEKRVLPISLSAISSRMLPLFHKFLCDINHIDVMDMDLNKKVIFQNKKELMINKVTFIPEVQAEKITLSRNKWVLNLELYKSRNNEIQFYSELIRDIENGLIPSRFYVRPIGVNFLNNLEQMNDFFKPQYINLKNITSYKLLYRITKNCNFLLLEESSPDYYDKKRYSGDFKNKTTEIGVESYFITMEND